jgi:hypothetical protein
MLDKKKYNPIALPELVVRRLQRWKLTDRCCLQVPKRCRLCGRKSSGNWFTGYYLLCVEIGCLHGDEWTDIITREFTK